MDEIYINVEHDMSVQPRALTNPKGSKHHGAPVVCLGLLSGILLAGLFGLGLHYYHSLHVGAAEFCSFNSNLTHVQTCFDKLSFLTKETNRLEADLDVMTKERDQLKANLTKLTNLLQKKNSCPVGWTKYSCSCYLLSNTSDSWAAGRDDCRIRGSDLVVVDSKEEQDFLVTFANEETWIGLNDIDQEGTWKWVDGSPVTKNYWANKPKQPDNGGGDPRWPEEDCATIGFRRDFWNDHSCDATLPWICENKPFTHDALV